MDQSITPFWREQHAGTGDQQGSLVADNAGAQAEQGTNSRCLPNRYQCDRPGLRHAKIHAEDQQRNGKDAPAGSR